MPLLLNVLRNADGPDYRKLRVKAMECAGLIGGSPLIPTIQFVDPLTMPFLKQSPLARTYSAPTQKRSSSFSCTSNVCRFVCLNPTTAGN